MPKGALGGGQPWQRTRLELPQVSWGGATCTGITRGPGLAAGGCPFDTLALLGASLRFWEPRNKVPDLEASGEFSTQRGHTRSPRAGTSPHDA